LNGRLRAYLVLGCNGLRHQDFCLCHGVQNRVLDLEKLDEGNYNRILDFFDSACGLFNSVMNDHNKCVNTLSLLYRNYDAYDQKTLNNIQSFIKIHKDCGIWISLILKEDYDNE
jgi:hypothetical protein